MPDSVVIMNVATIRDCAFDDAFVLPAAAAAAAAAERNLPNGAGIGAALNKEESDNEASLPPGLHDM